MISFIIGVAAAVVLYTFFPALAVYPSNWMRSAWAWVRSKGAK